MPQRSCTPALLLAVVAAAYLAAAAAKPPPAPIQAFSLADVEVRGSGFRQWSAVAQGGSSSLSVFGMEPPAGVLHKPAMPSAAPCHAAACAAACCQRVEFLLNTLPCRSHPQTSQLSAASEFGANFDQNAEYLLALSPDNLLYNFRWVLA